MNVRKFSRAAAVVAIAGVVLVGCAGGTEPSPSTNSGAGASSQVAAEAEHNDADVAFLQGMIPHHRQAVEMAELAASRSQDPQVLDLAARIGAAQEPEIQTMTAWLQDWGAEVPGADSTGGMDMSGMMTPQQMQQLGQAGGGAFDRMFLEMMTGHHRGAVEMAEVELREGENPEAKQLAQTIIDTQRAEITEMEALLQKA